MGSNRRAARAAGLAAGAAALGLLAAAPGAVAQELYVQQAGGGTLSGSRLVLRDVAPRITSFADRPERTAGSRSLRAFVDGWSRAIGEDPPNAALEIQGAPAGRDVAIVELRRPRYDARRRTLTFAVRRLGGGAVARGGLRQFGARADRRGIVRFGRASLFVDPGAVAAYAVVVLRAPPGATVSLSLSNASFVVGPGFSMPSINTPVSDPAATSSGAAVVFPRSLELTANGRGQGVLTAFDVGMQLPPGGAPVTGTATVPAGGTILLGWEGGPAKSLTSGPFTLAPPLTTPSSVTAP